MSRIILFIKANYIKDIKGNKGVKYIIPKRKEKNTADDA